MAILSSAWDGLNPHLMAWFYECDKDGNQVGDICVKAPLTDSNFELSLNWQSPFESSNPDSMKPSTFAMLQSGELNPVIDVINDMTGKKFNDNMQKTKDFVSQFEGKTGITKLNSIQTFSSMPPVKFQVTALFRAWKDAKVEVDDCVDQLMQWALPIELAKNGAMVNGLHAVNGDMKYSEALLPSKAPCLIGMSYKLRNYSPLVIESIGYPISSPITKDANYSEMLVPMTLCTLTALDRNDYKRFKI